MFLEYHFYMHMLSWLMLVAYLDRFSRLCFLIQHEDKSYRRIEHFSYLNL